MKGSSPPLVRWGTVLVALLAVLGAYLVSTSRPAQAAETLLSQGRPALASSVESASFPAAAAVDGNNGTRWASSFADNQWLQVDLGSAQAVNRVLLRWEAAYASGFQIQTSTNATNWTTIQTTTNGTGGEQSLVVNGNGRYVRVLITQRATQWGASLFEFQVYGGTPGGGPIVRVAEFLADCAFTHGLPDDPIVFPNLPGASHMHSFFGATVTNANTTVEDLATSPTSCNPSVDSSSYWVPTLYNNNVAVEPTGTTFYYLGEGVRDDVIATTQPLPFGLRIVAGNAKATGPNDNTISRWSCLNAGDAGAGHDFINCPPGSMLESYLDFPQCWNGRDLDSPDHKSHMAYPVNGDCPATHPVPVPKLRQVLRYPVNGSTAGLRLA